MLGKEQINIRDENFISEELETDEIEYSDDDIKFYSLLSVLILIIWIISLAVSFIK